jgi:5-methylcytosine-specific restriction endonuclease McrA
MVEDFPLVGPDSNSNDAKSRYRDELRRFANGEFKSEEEILSAIDYLRYLSPARWKMVEQFDHSELECNVFGHICPVFFNAEQITETKATRRMGQSRYMPREVMLKVVRRDGQMCQICHRNVPDNELAFDHVIPISKGGPTSVGNLRVLCADCNSKKSDSLSEILATWA